MFIEKNALTLELMFISSNSLISKLIRIKMTLNCHQFASIWGVMIYVTVKSFYSFSVRHLIFATEQTSI